jgi:hypothetical protein
MKKSGTASVEGGAASAAPAATRARNEVREIRIAEWIGGKGLGL